MRAKRTADHLGEGLDGEGLGDTRHAFEQHVALGQQADQHSLDQEVLAHDDSLDLEDGAFQGVHLGLQAPGIGRRRRARLSVRGDNPALGLAAHLLTSSTILLRWSG
jgi:hypothetical protein